jgi:hypothetical protein
VISAGVCSFFFANRGCLGFPAFSRIGDFFPNISLGVFHGFLPYSVCGCAFSSRITGVCDRDYFPNRFADSPSGHPQQLTRSISHLPSGTLARRSRSASGTYFAESRFLAAREGFQNATYQVGSGSHIFGVAPVKGEVVE